ncbi:DUF3179 domain-containing protein [Halobellus sp. EA9]|uniref:DUF3179 domain-containing protein n=1 Tax=Halobellus sp. EA9 TaxID=3421647 RepID=UPI003EBCF9C2
MVTTLTRRAVLAALGTGSVAGCLGGSRGGSAGDARERAANGSERNATTASSTGARPPPTTEERLPLPMQPGEIRDQAVSGGPPKDGIPSIDDPSFVESETASSWLAPGDPVFGVAASGETKAYPQSILVSHEICNDVVDDTPVSVTYCPLTGTAMGFRRGETTFGVSGRLVNNNLIMYDRATETWWPQVLATAVPGPWNGDPTVQSLSEFRVVWTTWRRWRETYPETLVLSRDTGFASNYDRDPYGSYNPRSGYYSPDSGTMFRSLSEDDRLEPKRVVIGTRTPEGAAAFEKEALRNRKVIHGTLGESPIVAAYEPTLDTGYVFRNPDETRYECRDGRIIDETGERHEPAALPGERLLAFDAMWFAWSGFYPDTSLYVRD